VKVTIHTPDPITFEPPLLVELGPERRELRGENATLLVYLDNARGDITAALSDPPLRTEVTVERDGAVLVGILQSVTLAAEATMSIEA
jgi:hypothetical protein